MAVEAVPNSKTAGRWDACGTPRFISIWAAFPGLESVKPAFFSAALNDVSSCNIIGAGSAGICETGGRGIGGMLAFATAPGVVPVAAVDGCFDQPMSERVVTLGVDADAPLAGVAVSLGKAPIFWEVFRLKSA